MQNRQPLDDPEADVVPGPDIGSPGLPRPTIEAARSRESRPLLLRLLLGLLALRDDLGLRRAPRRQRPRRRPPTFGLGATDER